MSLEDKKALAARAGLANCVAYGRELLGTEVDDLSDHEIAARAGLANCVAYGRELLGTEVDDLSDHEIAARAGLADKVAYGRELLGSEVDDLSDHEIAARAGLADWVAYGRELLVTSGRMSQTATDALSDEEVAHLAGRMSQEPGNRVDKLQAIARKTGLSVEVLAGRTAPESTSTVAVFWLGGTLSAAGHDDITFAPQALIYSRGAWKVTVNAPKINGKRGLILGKKKINMTFSRAAYTEMKDGLIGEIEQGRGHGAKAPYWTCKYTVHKLRS
jgi:hypothetical protein